MASQRDLVQFFVLFFLFSCLISLHTVIPLSRNLQLKNEETNAVLLEDTNQLSSNDMEMEEGFDVNGRMDIERNDYSPGANDRHIPKYPRIP